VLSLARKIRLYGAGRQSITCWAQVCARCYPNFGAYWNDRTEPIIADLVNGPARQAVPAMADDVLAAIINALDVSVHPLLSPGQLIRQIIKGLGVRKRRALCEELLDAMHFFGTQPGELLISCAFGEHAVPLHQEFM
jgi:hypothetical protein